MLIVVSSLVMSMGDCPVSVVIRTRDVESRLSELLRELSLQTMRPSELVIVDNYSSDARLREMSALLLSAKRCYYGSEIVMKLVPVADGEFSHAYSTNVGVFFTQNDLVCITNGHSLPILRTWVESGIKHFADPRIAGVGGYSSPHRDGTFWEKLAYDWGWRRLKETSGAYAKDSYFSTINCVIRRSLWEEYPFDERLPAGIPSSAVFGGEDFDWAEEMLARERQLVVELGFCVRHSHGESLPILFSKYYAWRQIRRRVRALRRPRKSYTRLKKASPDHCVI